ncbi:PaaI family thioesterase [Bacillaceae bacterium IKA-2]|nr:PaaI family thioesterase [Bacillaceae bacterium IKA-2]
MTRKQLFFQEIETHLQDATDEDIEIFSSLFDAARRKQKGEFLSYLSAIMNEKRKLLDNGDFEIRIPIHSLLNNQLSIVHGGITAALLDTAMGSFVNQSLPDHLGAVTTELKLNYLKPGVGKELICIASIVHRGSAFWVCEAKLYNDEESLIAIGTGSFFIIKKK